MRTKFYNFVLPSVVGHCMKIAFVVPREPVGYVQSAYELAPFIHTQRGPKPRKHMAMRTCRHGKHLYFLVAILSLRMF